MDKIMKLVRLFYPPLIALLVAVAFFSGSAAQEAGVTDDQVNAIAKQLYCPVCENIPLDVCPTQACAQWRDLIREMLASGKTEAEIKQYFVDHYGDRVLASPPAQGLHWLIYILPPASIAAGAFVLLRAFRSWKAPLPDISSEEAPTIEQDEYVRRLEEELRNR
jgi:cytochrome c-type biogenesis protein CcmH